jgi:hypothetical protein
MVTFPKDLGFTQDSPVAGRKKYGDLQNSCEEYGRKLGGLLQTQVKAKAKEYRTECVSSVTGQPVERRFSDNNNAAGMINGMSSGREKVGYIDLKM